MKKVRLKRLLQLAKLPDGTKVQFGDKDRDRTLIRCGDGYLICDDSGGFMLEQDNLDDGEVFAFVSERRSKISPKKKRKKITKVSQLRGFPDGTPIEFCKNDRSRSLYHYGDEITIVDDGGGFILDQSQLEDSPAYVVLSGRESLT